MHPNAIDDCSFWFYDDFRVVFRNLLLVGILLRIFDLNFSGIGLRISFFGGILQTHEKFNTKNEFFSSENRLLYQ